MSQQRDHLRAVWKPGEQISPEGRARLLAAARKLKLRETSVAALLHDPKHAKHHDALIEALRD